MTLSSDVVTVPALGTASVDVTVDPRVGDPGFYTGTVTAAGPGFAPVRTVMGWQVEQNLANVHFEALQPDGTPVISASYATLYNLDDPSMIHSATFVQGKADVRLPLGRYAILGVLENSEPGAELISGATLFTRDLEVTEAGDQTVVIDATKALPVTVDTEKKAQVTNIEQVLKRTLPGWGWPVQQATSFSTIVTRPGLPEQLYVLAEGELAGEETLTESWLLGAPKLDVQAVSASTTLDLAEDLRYAVTSPELKGKVSATDRRCGHRDARRAAEGRRGGQDRPCRGAPGGGGAGHAAQRAGAGGEGRRRDRGDRLRRPRWTVLGGCRLPRDGGVPRQVASDAHAVAREGARAARPRVGEEGREADRHRLRVPAVRLRVRQGGARHPCRASATPWTDRTRHPSAAR